MDGRSDFQEEEGAEEGEASSADAHGDQGNLFFPLISPLVCLLLGSPCIAQYLHVVYLLLPTWNKPELHLLLSNSR